MYRDVIIQAVAVLFFSLGSTNTSVGQAKRTKKLVPMVPIEMQAEGRQFEVLHKDSLGPSFTDPTYQRDFLEFYSRRAYIGAPPFIPHPVVGTEFESSKVCGSCHNQGGFVSKWKAYAPVTPHPERVNCRQCHVPQIAKKLFKQLDWPEIVPPAIKQTGIAGGPPQIPHSLRERGECLSCHAGPSAIREVKTSHPERVHCRQCHVPKTPDR